MKRTQFVAIHGHFYQPPRESPWLARAFPLEPGHERGADVEGERVEVVTGQVLRVDGGWVMG